MTEEQLKVIDAEIEPFKVKKGDPYQVSFLQRFGKDVTGNLAPQGEIDYLCMKGALVKGEYLGRQMYSVKFDETSSTTFPAVDESIRIYKWWIEKKRKLKEKLTDEIKSEKDDGTR